MWHRETSAGLQPQFQAPSDNVVAPCWELSHLPINHPVSLLPGARQRAWRVPAAPLLPSNNPEGNHLQGESCEL